MSILKKKSNKEKGVTSILLIMLFLSVVSVVGFGLSLLMLRQLKMTSRAGESVVAFYAAESGIERCLYEVRKNGATNCPFDDVSLAFDPNATYTTFYDGVSTITSLGRFKSTSRKIEVSW